ncbi:MAG: hypothetical protein JWN86_1755 [Planctomycetota bacterium]|nr:hypothetical protein [Planctomycetota bacterium]
MLKWTKAGSDQVSGPYRIVKFFSSNQPRWELLHEGIPLTVRMKMKSCKLNAEDHRLKLDSEEAALTEAVSNLFSSGR